MKRNKQICKDCKFCHLLKELINGEWVYRSICTLFIETEEQKDYDTLALIVNEEKDYCEVFTPRDDGKSRNVIFDGLYRCPKCKHILDPDCPTYCPKCGQKIIYSSDEEYGDDND